MHTSGSVVTFLSERVFARPSCPLLKLNVSFVSTTVEFYRQTTHAVSHGSIPRFHRPHHHISGRCCVLLGQLKTGANGASTASGPRAICGFRDGSLSVVDTAFGGNGGKVSGVCGGGGHDSSSSSGVGSGSGAIPWASKAGHIETVFSCAHRPGDPDTLATGSYGSSVKVWHVPTMDLKVGRLG